MSWSTSENFEGSFIGSEWSLTNNIIISIIIINIIIIIKGKDQLGNSKCGCGRLQGRLLMRAFHYKV